MLVHLSNDERLGWWQARQRRIRAPAWGDLAGGRVSINPQERVWRRPSGLPPTLPKEPGVYTRSRTAVWRTSIEACRSYQVVWFLCEAAECLYSQIARDPSALKVGNFFRISATAVPDRDRCARAASLARAAEAQPIGDSKLRPSVTVATASSPVAAASAARQSQ